MIVKCLFQQACLGPGLNFNDEEILVNEKQPINASQSDFIHGACHLGHHKNVCYDCKGGFGKSSATSHMREMR